MSPSEPIDVRDQLERRQAGLRLIVLGVVLAYVTMVKRQSPDALPLLLAISGFMAFSLLWYGAIVLAWLPRVPRRYFIIIVDTGMNSAAVYYVGSEGVIFYPLYLFVTIGHGMRFGPSHLVVAIISACLGFSTVLLLHPYWQQHLLIGFPLLVGLAILPLYYLTLIRRLNTANRHLQLELIKTTHKAEHDRLTQLPNRAYFYRCVERAIEKANIRQGSFAIVFMDLDGFKGINDQQGHEAGDQVLKQVAKALQDVIREEDVAARMGGDEFIILVDKLENHATVDKICERLLNAIRKLSPILSASMGVSYYPRDGKTTPLLIKNADQAMYYIKNRNKDGYYKYKDTPNCIEEK